MLSKEELMIILLPSSNSVEMQRKHKKALQKVQHVIGSKSSVPKFKP